MWPKENSRNLARIHLIGRFFFTLLLSFPYQLSALGEKKGSKSQVYHVIIVLQFPGAKNAKSAHKALWLRSHFISLGHLAALVFQHLLYYNLPMPRFIGVGGRITVCQKKWGMSRERSFCCFGHDASNTLLCFSSLVTLFINNSSHLNVPLQMFQNPNTFMQVFG